MDGRTITKGIATAVHQQSARFRAAVEHDLAPGRSRKERAETQNRVAEMTGRACNVGMARLTGSVTMMSRAAREMDILRATLREDDELRASVRVHLDLLATETRAGTPLVGPLIREVLEAAADGGLATDA
ncbi:MAG TPA: hypothetical protein VE913_11570 [Longimicrobium sp.]|nr:hypothetical protein [Longimicrobium sp.]